MEGRLRATSFAVRLWSRTPLTSAAPSRCPSVGEPKVTTNCRVRPSR